MLIQISENSAVTPYGSLAHVHYRVGDARGDGGAVQGLSIKLVRRWTCEFTSSEPLSVDAGNRGGLVASVSPLPRAFGRGIEPVEISEEDLG